MSFSVEALARIAIDLQSDIGHVDRFSRLIATLRQILGCDASALLRYEAHQFVPLAIDGLAQDVLGRRFALDGHPRLEAIARAGDVVRFPADSDLPDPYDGLIPSQESLKVHACVGLPLFAGLASDEQAHAMVTRHLGAGGEFATPLPLPSLAQHDPRCDQNRWRGAVFPALTPLVVEGLRRYGLDALAAEVRDRTLDTMDRWHQRTGTFWEYYDAQDQRSPADLPRGRRRGAFPEDGWSAAAYLVLLGDRTRGGSA